MDRLLGEGPDDGSARAAASLERAGDADRAAELAREIEALETPAAALGRGGSTM